MVFLLWYSYSFKFFSKLVWTLIMILGFFYEIDINPNFIFFQINITLNYNI